MRREALACRSDDHSIKMKRSTINKEDTRLLRLLIAVVVVATLYFARIVFIPLALALLLSFLLTPPVSFLEKIRFPRSVAIFLVIIILVGLTGLVGWKTSRQLVELTVQLPTYKETLQEKINVIKGPGTQSFHRASDTVKELEKEIATDSAPSAPGPAKRAPAALGATSSHPMAVEVVSPSNPLEAAQKMLGPVTTAGAIIVFTVFILAGREDLRNRFIRLAGAGRLNILTQAMDDATQRINRYLFLQLLINSGFGLIIGLSLYFIGLPNAALWGLGAAILRFLPYLGPPLAALFPFVLALAVFPGWHQALITAGVFAVLELFVGNVIEPLLYGAHLGLSPLAVLVAAVFWTLIWGFPGLVLSTPLTVCLVVIGRYVPGLNFFNVLFGDQPVLSPHAQYYQRLLAGDQTEAKQVLDQFLKEQSLEGLYSSVLIPALALVEQDRHRNELDDDTQNFIFQSTREIIEELGDNPAATPTPEESVEIFGVDRSAGEIADRLPILCIPARDDADDVVAMILSQLLSQRGNRSQSIPSGTTAEILSQVDELKPECICISALPPFAVGHARGLYAKLKARYPEAAIFVCLWQFDGDAQRAATLLGITKGDGFFTTLPEVLQHFASESARALPIVQQV
jgi:predicted PurR-regulated permease PerM